MKTEDSVATLGRTPIFHLASTLSYSYRCLTQLTKLTQIASQSICLNFKIQILALKETKTAKSKHALATVQYHAFNLICKLDLIDKVAVRDFFWEKYRRGFLRGFGSLKPCSIRVHSNWNAQVRWRHWYCRLWQARLVAELEIDSLGWV